METKVVKQCEAFGVVEVGDLLAFEGKAFLKDLTGATAMEFSVGSLPAGEALPFKHKHKQNEEVYVFLSGSCVMTLDGDDFPVASGSVVRVDPSVVRTHRNTGDAPLVFLCFQAKAGSLEQATLDDGELI